MSDFVVTVDNKKYNVNNGQLDKVNLNGKELSVQISELSPYTFKLIVNNKIYHITATKLENNKFSFLVDGHYFETFVRSRLEEEAAKILNLNSQKSGKRNIFSPMPGLIVKINKKVGDEIQADEPLILLEAMKMENVIKSPLTGKITEILIKEGSSVEKNQVLVVIN
ncbi:MAG: biotin attachment protein [Ignavibacteriales bacterium]|nr:biotin attachment protein [Ignavibacteriales bacterium]